MDERGYRGDGDRSKGKGGKRRERGFRDTRERRPRPTNQKPESFAGVPQVQMKTPIILTKASAERGSDSGKQITIKPRDDRGRDLSVPQLARSPLNSPQKPNKLVKSSSEHPSHTNQSPGIPSTHSSAQYQLHRGNTASGIPANTGPVSSDAVTSGMTSMKLQGQNESMKCVKIVDEKFHWSDTALEALTDQSDFLVVGVLGCQGVGKSTIMSLLANGMALKDKRYCIFAPQSRQTEELGTNETCGIDMTVTNERVIFLDTQPILNASILDNLIRHERNIPSEVTSAENYAELQSLQITTFLLTVCHVVLVVQDWFCDLNVMRFLKTAEMLKPTSGTHTTHEGSSSLSPEELDEYYPNIIFVYNKSTREDFESINVKNMLLSTSILFQHSRLKTKSSASILSSGILPCSHFLEQYSDINLFLLPMSHTSLRKPGNGIHLSGSSYYGHPSLEVLIQELRSQTFSIPRHHLTHHQLTEKNWFHFAARSWELAKKSPLLSEYNRLLP